MTTRIPDPYDRTTFDGKPLDNATAAAFRKAEQMLGYRLSLLQGIGGAVASAGTHIKGRAGDLTTYDADNKIRVLKLVGFAVWERDDLPGVWSEHLHAVLMFESFTNDRGIAASALRQIGSYLRGRDGLANDGPDNRPWRPEPVEPFTLEEYRAMFEKPRPPQTRLTRAIDRAVEAAHAAGQAAALLDDVDPSRVKARAEIDDLRKNRRELRATADRLRSLTK